MIELQSVSSGLESDEVRSTGAGFYTAGSALASAWDVSSL